MTHLSKAFLIAAAAVCVATPAPAACRDDLVTVSQTVETSRTELQAATGAAKCTAYRKHIAALRKVGDVFARCDTGKDRAKNAAQVKGTISELTGQMKKSCKS